MFHLQLQVQTIHPKKGITSSRAWVSKSFVKNFLGILYRNMISETDWTTFDTGGNARDYSNYHEQYNIIPCIQQFGGSRVFGYYAVTTTVFGDDVGIQVGDGSAANTALTYTLHQIIPHGVASGELEYSGGFVGEVVVNGADSYFDIERILRNNSGGSIVIKEYAIVVANAEHWQGAAIYPHLIVRDVFTEEVDWVTVATTEYLKVSYRLSVTV